ncbi:hypothetical protein GCM10010112_61840 [Actinoplanes lobatus]|uniref:ElaB/YqjD/DUF883 family membrane-anchored ribosome-binding protein n=1 Tax=Actinoplanes lobatus TaxID=113568 RepID=A0A7W7H905_9ACTN|nr:DUF3618 domain-containing protein [Actinoplanes lobatus]MBB4746037.1 ElaB/YqjD/DUF883 family membrane-anchored ribosome-binding protein [Actinoplanes lobatus]GGN83474.1 hypothetical protein GCM10010112_61840 [Actinoplanes lobatus]GIE42373.1 hypothetical protein Alo02nite_52710 [Actinoplanes lobatus]
MSEINGSAAKPDLVALREEIRQTRSDLGETVQALAARADVKARAREQVVETTERVRSRATMMAHRIREADKRDLAYRAGSRVRANPWPAALTIAGLAAIAGIVLIVRGRR